MCVLRLYRWKRQEYELIEIVKSKVKALLSTTATAPSLAPVLPNNFGAQPMRDMPTKNVCASKCLDEKIAALTES